MSQIVMKYFLGFLFVLIVFFMSYDDAFAQEQTCDINKTIEARKILEKDPVVQEFLKDHPSAFFEHPPNYDEGNPWTTSVFYHNGLSLGIVVSQEDPGGNCYWIRAYHVEYEVPTSGLGIGMSRSQTFESEKMDDALLAVQNLTNPHKQMKIGIPLHEIKCKEGLVPIFKRDRIHPACVTDSTWNELLLRGWAPLRMGMPAETNILITYNATMVYPQKVTKELDPRSPHFNMIFFVNNDVVAHTINSIDENWSTGVIESGKTGSIIFNQTGSYKYYVVEKPNTSGRIQFEHAQLELEENEN